MQINHIASRLKMNDLQNQALAGKMENLSRKASKDDAKLRKVCNEFESIFINQMYKSMRKAIKTGSKPLLHGGMGEEIFKDMLYEKYSLMTAKTNSLGIADMIYDYVNRTR